MKKGVWRNTLPSVVLVTISASVAVRAGTIMVAAPYLAAHPQALLSAIVPPCLVWVAVDGIGGALYIAHATTFSAGKHHEQNKEQEYQSFHSAIFLPGGTTATR